VKRGVIGRSRMPMACSRRVTAAPYEVSRSAGELMVCRLTAGGNEIRTVSPAGGVGVFVSHYGDFSGGGKSSGGNMSRSRNLDRMTRYQWFESRFLQRRVTQTRSIPTDLEGLASA
jgi:hypothetical protein